MEYKSCEYRPVGNSKQNPELQVQEATLSYCSVVDDYARGQPLPGISDCGIDRAESAFRELGRRHYGQKKTEDGKYGEFLQRICAKPGTVKNPFSIKTVAVLRQVFFSRDSAIFRVRH